MRTGLMILLKTEEEILIMKEGGRILARVLKELEKQVKLRQEQSKNEKSIKRKQT